MYMNVFMGNVALGWLVASLALIAEHMALWELPWRLSEPANYVIGMLTVLGGCAVWGWRQAQSGPIDPWLAVIAFGIIASSGGWIVLAYGLRGRLTIKRARETAIQQRKNAIAGALDDTLDDLRRN